MVAWSGAGSSWVLCLTMEAANWLMSWDSLRVRLGIPQVSAHSGRYRQACGNRKDPTTNYSESACVGAVISGTIGVLLYFAACPNAANWGEVVRGAFDLYRHDLVRQLGVEVPKAPITLSDERKLWRSIQRVTYYLED